MDIRTPDQRLRVFISSTIQELAFERGIVQKAIEQLHLIPVLFELGARPHPPRDLYRAYLAQSHIFIGIYWEKYGWIAPGMEISGLEDEYLLSKELPRLIYLKTPALDREPGLVEMLKRIENEGNSCYKRFSSPEELERLVAYDLVLLLSERFERSIVDKPVATSQQANKSTNLPAEITQFIGREQLIATVCSLLEEEQTHLVTLTGPGGVGKTRLALKAAALVANKFPDGVWLVELASLSDPSLVDQYVANEFGLREENDQSLRETLVRYFLEKSLLLILDNSEHLIDGVSNFAKALLSSAPKMRILATSRSSLGITGEIICDVPPLSTPDREVDLIPEALERYEAVKLFVDRARAIRSDFSLSQHTSSSVAQICTRLDGIPLAIELAAARVRVLTVTEIAARLDDRFRLLVGSRTAITRQQTLRALFDWSYTLLTDDERCVLRRLAVFAGGSTLSAIEAVCSGGTIEKCAVLDILSQLIEKSLVIADFQESLCRYRFLETIRQYSKERLVESGEDQLYFQKHAEFFLTMVEQSSDNLGGSRQGSGLERLEAEHDNLRSALDWLSQQPNQNELFLRIAVPLSRFWDIRGHVSEGRVWLERALAGNQDTPTSLYATGLHGAGILAEKQGDYIQAEAMFQQSLELFRDFGDKAGMAAQLDELGEIAHLKGDYERAADLCNESLAFRFEIGDKEGIVGSINHLGMIARDQGKHEFSRDLLEESLTLSRELDNRLMTANALKNLGIIEYYLCQYIRARELLDEAFILYEELNDRQGISDTLEYFGNVAKDQGDFKQAIRLYNESLEIKQSLDDKRGVALATAWLAEVAFYQGRYHQAEELINKSMRLSQALGIKRGIILSLGIQAFISSYLGDYNRAQLLADECLDMATSMNAPRPIGYCKEVFAILAYTRGELDTAKNLFQEANQIFNEVGDLRNVAATLINLARTAYRQGDEECALHYLDESLLISRQLDLHWTMSFVLEIKGLIWRSQGNLPQAFALFKESLSLAMEQDNQQGITNCLGALAGLAILAKQPEQAVRLFSTADNIRNVLGVKMGKDDQQEYDQYLAILQNQMDSSTFDVIWKDGSSISLEEILEDLQVWNPPW